MPQNNDLMSPLAACANFRLHNFLLTPVMSSSRKPGRISAGVWHPCSPNHRYRIRFFLTNRTIMISRYPFYPRSPGSHLIGDIRQYRLVQPTLRTRLQDENVYHLKKKTGQYENTTYKSSELDPWSITLDTYVKPQHVQAPCTYPAPYFGLCFTCLGNPLPWNVQVLFEYNIRWPLYRSCSFHGCTQSRRYGLRSPRTFIPFLSDLWCLFWGVASLKSSSVRANGRANPIA